jgi:hypothetical protein
MTAGLKVKEITRARPVSIQENTKIIQYRDGLYVREGQKYYLLSCQLCHVIACDVQTPQYSALSYISPTSYSY